MQPCKQLSPDPLQMKFIGLALLLAAIACAASTALGQDTQGNSQAYSAVAIGIGGQVGGKSIQFTFQINHWTSDDEVQRLAETLKTNGPDALRSVLVNRVVGRIAPVGGLATDIAVARKHYDGSNTVITVMTVRNLSFTERGWRTKGHPFGFLRVTLDNKRQGEGQIMVAAKIRFDKKKGSYEIEGYGNQYIKAVDVRPAS